MSDWCFCGPDADPAVGCPVHHPPQRPNEAQVLPDWRDSQHVQHKLEDVGRRVTALGLLDWQKTTIGTLVSDVARLAFEEGHLQGCRIDDELRTEPASPKPLEFRMSEGDQKEFQAMAEACRENAVTATEAIEMVKYLLGVIDYELPPYEPTTCEGELSARYALYTNLEKARAMVSSRADTEVK